MPSPNPTVRRQHSGNAVPTTLAAPIASAVDASFTIAASTGWPDGSVGNFVVTINAGQGDVEKILCSTRVGTTVNVVTRGYEGTTAAGHATTATATHTISATEIDEANQHTNATTGVHGVAGAVVGTTDSQTLTNKTLTNATASGGFTATNPATAATVLTTVTGSNNGVLVQPGAAGSLGLLIQGLASQAGALLRAKLGSSQTGRFVELLDQSNATLFAVESDGTATLTATAASTIGGVTGTSLAADRTAWTTYTPTFTNCTSPAGEFAYKVIGKSLFIRGYFTAGTVTATGPIKISLPGGVTLPGTSVQRIFGGSGVVALFTVSPTGGNANLLVQGDGAAGNLLTNVPFQGVIEVA